MRENLILLNFYKVLNKNISIYYIREGGKKSLI